MSDIATIAMKLEADSAAFTAGAKQAAESLDGVEKHAQKAKEQMSGVESALKSLKETAGRGSELDELFKTLRGAGAIMGISLVGEELKKSTEQMLHLKEQFDAGKISGAGMANEIAKGIPVLGGFVSAFENLRELATGEKASIEAINESVKRGNELMENTVKIHEQEKKQLDEIAEKIRKADEALQLSRTTNPEDRKRLEEQFKVADKAQDDQKQWDQIEGQAKASLAKQIALIHSAAEETKKTMEDSAIAKLHKGWYTVDIQAATEQAKTVADAQAAAQENIAIRSAQRSNAAYLAEAQKGLDKANAMRDQAAKNEATHAAVEARVKSERAGYEEMAHAAGKFMEDVGRVGKDLNKQWDEVGKKFGEDWKKHLEEAAKAKEEFWKREQEGANKYIEETQSAWSKFQDTLTDIEKKHKEGLLTDAQAKIAAEKAQLEELNSQKEDAGGGSGKLAGAETRRFDFIIPKAPEDTAKQALEVQKKHLESSIDIQQKTADLWRFANDQNQSLLNVVDF